MVRIRLRRVGSKKQPSYRIVVADSRSPRDGRYIETIGYYHPRTQPETIEYQEDRALHWLNVGARPSEAVERFFKRYGTMARLARLQQGESLEALVAEAEAEKAARPVISPKTEVTKFAAEPKQQASVAAETVEPEVEETTEETAEEPEETAEPVAEDVEETETP